MMENSLRKLDTPLATELAENILLLGDIQSSLAAMKLCHEKYAERDSSTEEGIIGKSLFRDAVVQFVGCFDKTAKFPLSVQEVYSDPKWSGLFQWFQDMRDAYAAHKFGAQRQCIVGVLFDSKQGVGFGYLRATYKGQLKSDGPNLISFMEVAQVFLGTKIAQLEQRLIEVVRILTPDQINALEIAKAHTLAQDEVRLSRPALQRTRSSGATSAQVSWTVVLPDGSKDLKVMSHSPKTGTSKT